MAFFPCSEELDELHYQDTDSDVPEQRDSKCKVKWTQEEVSDTEGQLRGMEVAVGGWQLWGGGQTDLNLGCVCPDQYDEGEALLNKPVGPLFLSDASQSIPGPCQY